ncbi:uncharacterized protein LOC111478801 [Cucurbita maxima]|uniref:Uncharacterized protein LOC111478801 n=1 Tax=Cucurbita maxima TaxID=3661 RepID=A0A6J1IPN3_CUCMA|nr:uncharacterized protein LOC111478801 [Cucurbita maxima]
MKKLCRKNTVHPSPPIISDFLSFLPAVIFTLTVALSADDKEVLAYLISCSNTSASLSNLSDTRKSGRKPTAGKVGVDHAPLFDCDCFMCYRRYWARWDSSPNRQLIHEIIEAYEDGLAKPKGTASKQRNFKKERRKKNKESVAAESSVGKGKMKEASESVQQESSRDGNGQKAEGEERGSVSRFVSFVGEKIWSAWG